MNIKVLVKFVWDEDKERVIFSKHKVNFSTAQGAFFDPKRIIAIDEFHGENEERYFCIGKTPSGICTVRFVYCDDTIRIFGAGFWRKGRKLYEKENR